MINTMNQLSLQTPFGSENICGNPLPYASKGIDSPRTFAYKMYEQWRAREWYKSKIGTKQAQNLFPERKTTIAMDGYGIIDYDKGYVDETEIFRKKTPAINLTIDNGDFCYEGDAYTPEGPAGEPDGSLGNTIKPFLPGLLSRTRDQYIGSYNSLYSPDKIAGTDSIGILTGSLSMGEYDKIYNLYNQKVIKILDEYYQMNKGRDENYGITLTGLDNQFGKPSFYTEENTSFLNTPYRLTIGDIEKCSVIVPDISLIQKGDILVNVKYNIGGTFKFVQSGFNLVEQRSSCGNCCGIIGRSAGSVWNRCKGFLE